VAQEKTRIWRTRQRQDPVTGKRYPWPCQEQAMVNHWHFYDHPGQHALDDQRVEQVDRAEHLPRVERDLRIPGRRAPGPLSGDRPAARTTEPVVIARQCPARSPAAILACFDPTRPSNSACII
jgi:hypothetical protein